MRLKIFLVILSLVFFRYGIAWSEPTFEVAWNVHSEAGFSSPNELRDSTTGKTLGIVACEVGRGLVCFSPDGQRLWEISMTPPVTAGPAVGDMNGDGKEEVIAADGGGHLYLIDDHGSVLWTAKTHDTIQAESCPAIGDLDNDGLMEIVVGDRSGGVNCFDRTGKRLWTFVGPGDQMGPPMITDLYTLPGCEIIITSHNGHIYALGADGRWLWQIFHEKECMPGSLPVLADVEGDGKPEIYIGGGLHHFLRIDPEIPSIVFDENVYLHINTSILATDLEADGKDDVVFGVKGGKVFCYTKGGFAWKREFLNTIICSSPLALNLDNDPSLEMTFSNRGIKILDSDGSVLSEFNTPAYNSQPITGDFNQDGFLDVILCGQGLDRDSGLVFQKWNVPYTENARQWLTVGGDRTHTRKHPHASDLSRGNAPLLSVGTSSSSFSAVEEPHLSYGRNVWRYDVSNPEGRRLVLLSEIAYPGGSFERFSNHVYSDKERISFEFEISDPGIYQVTTSLIDSGQRALLSSHQAALTYGGPSDDLGYLSGTLTKTIQRIDDLARTNYKAAAYYRSEVQSISGQILALKHSLDTNPQPSLGDSLENLSDQAKRVDILTAAGQRMASTGTFAVWNYSPWAYFDPVKTLPESCKPAQEIKVSLCMEEYDSQALNVTNFSGKSMNIRVWAEDFKSAASITSSTHIEFRRAMMVPTLRGEVVADALPLLDQADILPIPSGETQQLWLTLHAKGLKPGLYLSTLHLKSVDPDPTHITVPIRLEVVDLSLPRPSPLKFCVWSYAAKEPDYILRDLDEHGVNVHFAPPPSAVCNERGEIEGTLDFEAHDSGVLRLAPHGLILFSSPQGGLSGQPIFSDLWNKAFVVYLRAWMKHLKELGLGYEHFALYPYDEPSTPFAQTSQDLVKVAKLIREADPSIQIYTDPTSGTNIDSLRMWEGLVDIWCPSAELLERFGDELLPFTHRAGRETWFYDASGRSRTLSCLGIYRWRFWYAWNLGLTGVGWWTYTHGDYLWDGSNPEGDYFYHVYDAPGTVVTSKRWEAAREGIEEYEILYLLREALHKAEERGVSSDSLRNDYNLLSEIPLTVEKKLHGVGRRLPLNTTSIPLYETVTNQVQEARSRLIEACLRVNLMGR